MMTPVKLVRSYSPVGFCIQLKANNTIRTSILYLHMTLIVECDLNSSSGDQRKNFKDRTLTKLNILNLLCMSGFNGNHLFVLQTLVWKVLISKRYTYQYPA